MSFVNLLGDKINVYRIEAITGTNKSRFQTATVSLAAHIIQIAPEKAVEYGGAVGKTYKIFTEADADIKEGDILIDQNTGDRYKVNAGGLNTMNNVGSSNIQHKEIIVTKLRKNLD